MVSRDDRAVGHVQFADGIHPVKRTAATLAVDVSFEKSSSGYDLDSEERAREIAEQDLGLKKKQVR
jgi:hypothetical protein